MKRHGGDAKALVSSHIQITVEAMYATSEENKFIEVTYANGEKEVLYFKDFASGALIEGIVSRAKKFAVKRAIAKEGHGFRAEDFIRAIREEFKEHEDLPNTTNPDDWAKVAGKKGEKIVHLRTISGGARRVAPDRNRYNRSLPLGCHNSMHEAKPIITPRVLGTETEFGIASRDPAALDPVSNSIQVIGHYPGLPAPHAVWDYENENPLLDARGFEVEGERERPGPDYNRQLNKVLANGGRLYVDGAHPEYSTPECTNARELVAFERVGERLIAQALERITQSRGREQFVLYKNNSDGKGNSYGYHEDYLLSRTVLFERIVQVLTPFFVTRQIFAGSGKVGAREPDKSGRLSDIAARRFLRDARRSEHDDQAADHQYA